MEESELATERKDGCCALCAREEDLTFHHLIPRSCHRNKWFRKHFGRDEMKGRGIYLCRPCHDFIHRQYDEKELGRRLHTLDSLRAEPRVRDFVGWIRRRA